MIPLFISYLLLSLLPLIGAQSSFSPARPPAIPLAVRSPYLNSWLDVGKDGGNGGYLAGEWPVHWSNQITGWAGLIRVDGTPYTWLGAPVGQGKVQQTAFEYTTTKSIFTLNVNNAVEMIVTFMSPITPDDLMRQSLVFSYLSVDVKSLDGNNHDVQLYADISAEWVSGDRTATAQWDYGVTGKVAYHRVYRQEQLLFSEIADQAEWGYWYWATDNADGMTHQSGQDVVVRGQFANKGSLANTQDSNYRGISNNWPVFGFAYDLGSVGTYAVTRRFSLGLTQDVAIQYAGPKGTIQVPSLWKSYFSTDVAAVEFFHGDYDTAYLLSSALDNQVASDSTAAAGQNYLTLTSLSARQAFGATQLCGTPDQTYLFLKEISSDGNVNTVDVIFPMHPILVYTNATMLKYLLEPLFELQEAGLYPNAWAMHDAGSSYPNATGHPSGNDEQMPLEECGNMLIMALAYYTRSKDVAYLHDHYDILKRWTSFLVAEALYPANQISTDDFAGALPNQTNLALKGMIGIQAMSVIAEVTGNTDDSKNFSSIAHNYIDQWQTLGVNHNANPPHSTLSYGQDSSWGLLYNLFGDKELGLNLVPQSIYDMQSNFYPTVNNQYGVPLDTRHTYTKGDWESFCAAIASDSTRDKFFSDLANWINTTPTNRALTDLYDTNSGDYPGITFVARPVMGGTFALLALG